MGDYKTNSQERLEYE